MAVNRSPDSNCLVLNTCKYEQHGGVQLGGTEEELKGGEGGVEMI